MSATSDNQPTYREFVDIMLRNEMDVEFSKLSSLFSEDES